MITSRKITIMALIAGIVLGAGATEGFSAYRESQNRYLRSNDNQSFQRRAQCKSVADAYAKDNTDLRDNSETGRSVTVDKADYSPARNSCIAETDTTQYFRGGASDNESVRDLLSGETLFSVSGSQIGSGSTAKRTGEDIETVRVIFLPKVWDYVMNNADEPVALEKEYVQMESELSHKGTAPASSATEPNDWKTVPVTEYDAQGKPIVEPQHK